MTPLLSAAGAVAALTIQGSRLVAPVPVTVMTPPSYGTGTTRYPVLYFLHDGQGDENVLFAKGIARALDEEMRAGRLPEMLVVTPRGGASWFVDSYDGKIPYGDFLRRDLVPWVDAHYRTIATRSGRGVAGISMGGYGALRWALDRPELFTVAGGLSPAVQQLNWNGVAALPFFIRPMMKRVFGGDALSNNLRTRDLYDSLLSDPSLARRAPEILVRCGTEDKYRLYEITAFFQRFLSALGVKSSLVLEPGVHDWPYWRRAFPALARDIGQRLLSETARTVQDGPS